MERPGAGVAENSTDTPWRVIVSLTGAAFLPSVGGALVVGAVGGPGRARRGIARKDENGQQGDSRRRARNFLRIWVCMFMYIFLPERNSCFHFLCLPF